MAYQDIIIADSPVRFWRLDDSTGTDTMAGGNLTKGASTAAPTTGVAGKQGTSWSFDGGDSASYTMPTLTTTMSFEMWFKGDGATKASHTFLRFDGADVGVIRMQGDGSVYPGEIYGVIGSAEFRSVTRYDDNAWHHLVVTVNGTAVKVYVDNVLKSDLATGKASYSFAATGYMGRDAAGTVSEHLIGGLDEVAIYNTTLSPAQVTAHYNAGNAISVAIDETTATATVQGVEGTYEGHGKVVSPSFDSTWINDGTGEGLRAGLTNLNVQNTSTEQHAQIKFTKAAIGSNLTINSAKLRVVIQDDFQGTSVSARNVAAYKDVNGVRTGTPSETKNLSIGNAPYYPAGYTVEFDVTSIVADAFANGLTDVSIGLFGESAGVMDGAFHSNEATTVANRPVLEVYATAAPVSITEDVLTPAVTAQAPDTIIVVGVSDAIDLSTASVSVTSQDVSLSEGTTYDAASATSNLQTEDVTIVGYLNPNADVPVETAGTNFAAVEASLVIPTVIDLAETPNQSITANDVTVELSQGVIADLDSPKINVTHHQLTDVNGEPIVASESDDNYFESTWNTFGGTTFGLSGNTPTPVAPETAIWYRFNERSGTAISDRAWVYRNAEGDIVPTPGIESGKTSGLDLHNVVIGLNNGPEGRHNFEFTGQSYISGPGSGIQGLNNNLEFTIKTERPTQFIMGGDGLGAGTINNPPIPPWELWMVDGVLELRQFVFDGTPWNSNDNPYTVTKMRTNLADNQWHHVVIQRAATSVDERSIGWEAYFMFEAYVDGRLEIRRRVGNIAWSFPQFIGGRVSQWYKSGGWQIDARPLPYDQWFQGEMTELVYRYDDNLSEDEVTLQRDNVMGIDTYRATPARLTATTEDVFVKGNKPRVLVLDFGSYVARGMYPGTDPVSRQVPFPVGSLAKAMDDKMTYASTNSVVYADFPGYGESGTPWYGSSQAGNTQWFRKDVRQKMDGAGNVTNETYRDEITDNYRLIDLEKDINMDDYELISIIGFPQNNLMWERYMDMDFKNLAPMIPAKVQVENLLKQVRDQVVNHRKSLYVTDPFSALGMGIISDVDAIPKFQEHYVADERIGANTGGLDWHAFITDPFHAANGTPTPVEFLPYDVTRATKENLKRASTYEDMHANVKQQVRSVIAGLTTNYGWIKTDDIVWWNVNPMANPPFQRSCKFMDRRGTGLEIGDQFYLAGEHIFDWGFGDSLWEANAIERRHGWIAAPMSAINVGKAVTSFSPYVYATTDGDVDKAVGNSYGDHAVSIAVEPGDVWNGERVSGKVYVNFTEFNVWNPEFGASSQIMFMHTRHPEVDQQKYTLFAGKYINTGYDRGFTVTNEQLAYQWSTHYGSWGGSEIPLPQGGKSSDWGWSSGGVRQGGGFSTYGAGEAMQWSWKPAVPLEEIETSPMYHKAFMWLLSDLDVSGTVNANVDTAQVNANANDVTVETTENVIVDVSSVHMHLESYTDADTLDPDVTVMASVAELTIKVTGLLEEIVLDTPTLTVGANNLDPGELEVNWAEALVFTLPRQSLTLTMEET